MNSAFVPGGTSLPLLLVPYPVAEARPHEPLARTAKPITSPARTGIRTPPNVFTTLGSGSSNELWPVIVYLFPPVGRATLSLSSGGLDPAWWRQLVITPAEGAA